MSMPDAERPRPYSLSELPRGQDCDFFCYIANRESLLTRAGKPYLRITIRDAARTISFPVWRDAPWWAICDEALTQGAFCKIRATFFESAHGPQFEIKRIRPATAADLSDGFDPEKLLPPARGDSKAILEAVHQVARREIRDAATRQTVIKILDDHKDGWLNQPGGRWHHAQRGGLIEHTWFALQNAIHLCERYAMAYPEFAQLVNRDLVIAGVILHDAGRIMELRIDPTGATTTTAGDLIGHHVLGRDLVHDSAIRNEVDQELLLRLEHILLSHHARADYGSPMPPMTLEALIVHLADDADAKVIAALEALHCESGAEWTSKRNPTGQKWYRGAKSPDERSE
jgi:3'-5' exoribonuclease